MFDCCMPFFLHPSYYIPYYYCCCLTSQDAAVASARSNDSAAGKENMNTDSGSTITKNDNDCGDAMVVRERNQLNKEEELKVDDVRQQRVHLILLGASGVGKTNLLERYIKNTFSPTVRTIGIDFRVVKVDIAEKDSHGEDNHGSSMTSKNEKPKHTQLLTTIYDTAGQERFNDITSHYIHNKQGAALVYDITNRKSFEYIPTLLSLINTRDESDKLLGGGKGRTRTFLIGNKIDLLSEQQDGNDTRRDNSKRAVSVEEGWAMARDHGMMGFWEVSAKTGVGVIDCINEFILFCGTSSVKRKSEYWNDCQCSCYDVSGVLSPGDERNTMLRT